jgi:sugar phosphate isomerase/epimerase
LKHIFSTLPCMDYDALQLKELCDKHGFFGVEVRTKPDNSFVYADFLNIINVGSSICIRDVNEKQLEDAKAILSQMENTNILGMRVFLGNFRRRFSDPKFFFEHSEIVKSLRTMCDYTSKEIWVETHNEYSTGKVLKTLIEDVDRKNLKIIWDIMHPFEDGESPEETWELIGKYISHVHIKDGKKRDDSTWHDYEYTPIGEGELPITEIIGILNNGNYTGCLSLEWENLWRDELKKLNWSVDKILKSYMDYMRMKFCI